MSRLSSLFGWTGAVSTQKTGLFTVQQTSELEDYTKPSAGWKIPLGRNYSFQKFY